MTDYKRFERVIGMSVDAQGKLGRAFVGYVRTVRPNGDVLIFSNDETENEAAWGKEAVERQAKIALKGETTKRLPKGSYQSVVLRAIERLETSEIIGLEVKENPEVNLRTLWPYPAEGLIAAMYGLLDEVDLYDTLDVALEDALGLPMEPPITKRGQLISGLYGFAVDLLAEPWKEPRHGLSRGPTTD